MKCVLVLLMFSQAALAGLTLTINPAAQPASLGAEVLFYGTLTNTSGTEQLFLNDLSASFTADPQSDTALSSNAFFANVPGILLPGEVYDGPLFRISLSGASPATNYTGTITFQGGANIVAADMLASAPFTLLATTVEQWRHQTFGDAAGAPAAADVADFDHDGIANLLEYALNLNALSPDISSLPAAFVLDGHYTYSFIPNAPSLTYTVESSSDLLNWSTLNVEPVIIANPVPPNRLTFRHKDAMSQLQRAFLRLKITR